MYACSSSLPHQTATLRREGGREGGIRWKQQHYRYTHLRRTALGGGRVPWGGRLGEVGSWCVAGRVVCVCVCVVWVVGVVGGKVVCLCGRVGGGVAGVR